MKTLICLKGNFEAQPIVARVKALGHRVVLVDPDPACAARVLADEFVQADHYDPGATLAALDSVPGLAPDGVLCCGGDTPHTAAAVAARWGLPGLAPGQAALSVDKLAQKTALRDAGLPVPIFWPADDGVTREFTACCGALIIKPVDSRGARGVTMVIFGDNSVDIDAAFLEAHKASPTGRVMVEEYLPGPQLSTESVVVDGKVIFTAIALRNYDRFERGDFGPHPVEDGFSMPYGDDALRAEVDDVLARACAALGWKTLSVKADLIIHDGRVVILELAARLSGGFLGTHGTALAYGYDFIGDAIRLALGEPVYVAHSGTAVQHVAQRYLFPQSADIGRTVVRMPTLHEIKTLAWDGPISAAFKLAQQIGDNNFWALGNTGSVSPMFVASFATYAIRHGDVIAPVVSHGQRWGQALATGATADEARARAEAAVAAMKRAVVLA